LAYVENQVHPLAAGEESQAAFTTTSLHARAADMPPRGGDRPWAEAW
jgi:hypothetical protein